MRWRWGKGCAGGGSYGARQGGEELEALPLGPWAARRRKELLELLDHLERPIAELKQEAERQAAGHPEAARLMTHPGVGPMTSLAFVLTIGTVDRFARSREVSGYLGLEPSENSSAGGGAGVPLASKGVRRCVGCWSRPGRRRREK